MADFKARADQEVPDIIAHFGKDAPPAHYEIDFGGKTVTSDKTKSIVISEYTYTGGANGMDTYHTLTSDTKEQKLLTLNDIIKTDKQNEFLAYVKNSLLNWAPAGSTAPVVFPDAVNALKFQDLSNWSMDNATLILYFSKYDIGPGVLGAVAYPLSRSQIKDFLGSEY